MERAWLEAELAKGRSVESLAREVGRDASTVAYWMRKFGLVSAHADRHRARGGIARETLLPLVEEGLSVRAIAKALGVSATTVRHWLRRHDLHTSPALSRIPVEAMPAGPMGRCPRHGRSRFVLTGTGYYRCAHCRTAAVSRRRRRVKSILVAEAGGACFRCGYSRYVGALHFHHIDPRTKRFSLAGGGLARSLASARAEAAKCVLLCANCHAEVEAGVATIAPRASGEGDASG